MLHRCWKFQSQNVQIFEYVHQNTDDQHHGPGVLFERNLYGHPLAGLLWERQFEKVLLEHDWEKFQVGKVCSITEKGLFLSVYVDDMKLAGKKRNIDPMWKVFMKDVDLGEPT